MAEKKLMILKKLAPSTIDTNKNTEQKTIATTNESNLKIEDDNHWKDFKFTCEICGEKFFGLTYLIKHGITHETFKNNFLKLAILKLLTKVNSIDKEQKKIEDINKSNKIIETLNKKCASYLEENMALQRKITLLEKEIKISPKKRICNKVNKVDSRSKNVVNRAGVHQPYLDFSDFEDEIQSNGSDESESNANRFFFPEVLEDENDDVTSQEETQNVNNVNEGEKVDRLLCPLEIQNENYFIEDDETKLFSCTCCNKHFLKLEDLDVHMSIHKSDPFHCSNCNKTFHSKQSLTLHMRSHAEDQMFDCKYCLQKFCGRSALRKHMLTHPSDKPYQCPMCESSFSISLYLIKHKVEKHNMQKPFLCSLCSKGFLNKSKYTLHMRMHNNEKLFKCEVCDKSWFRKDQLTMHNMQVHDQSLKPYKCSMCTKAFSQKGHFVQHMRTHTGEKPFQCEFCGKYFNQKYNLNEHIARHTGERKHLCSYCGKGFMRNSHLVAHIKVHEKLEKRTMETD